MSDDLLFREVDEELRQDQLKKLWAQYGLYVVGLAVLIVAAVAGYNGWTYWQAKRAAEAGARYEAALELAQGGKEAEALAQLSEIADDAPRGYETLASLSHAAYLARTGETEQAVAVYDGLAASAGDEAIRNLARVRAALLLLDTADRADIDNRLAPIDDPASPWRHSAREIRGLAAFRAGDQAAALGHFQRLMGDAAAPQDARQRAQVIMSLIMPSQEADGSGKAPDGAGGAESR